GQTIKPTEVTISIDKISLNQKNVIELKEFNAEKGIQELNHKATSGAFLTTDPNKTTTILGTYIDDTQYIIKELNLEKSTNFGARKGGFNLLNTPDELYKNPMQFWNEYNKPWLDNVIKRGDNIILATSPIDSKLYKTNRITGTKELTGFGREYYYLLENGYKFDSKTNQMIKGK
ncbi:hypothetical protein JMI89_11415, partial [Frischella sp. Ac48]|uniref:hypothetical protein n=1 Tax=Frischella sp. Ac48 TaxID=2804531 RepID=UPI001C7CDAF2